MHIRVVHSQLRPETVSEATQVWQKQVAPSLKGQPGFVRSTLTGDRATGRALTLTFWQSEADAHTYEASALSRELLGLFTPYWAAPPTVELLEVMDES